MIIDVGATGGPDRMWKSAREGCRYITFDPDPRAELPEDPQMTNIPLGLSDRNGHRTLHLTKFPSASSLYRPNQDLMNSFVNYSSTEIIGEQTIEVTTLDDVISHPNEPCFLKLDAEGSDLDILRGGTKTTLNGCLGIQVEVSFAERHIDAPLIGEVDEHLRSLGFLLFDLNNESWLRRNRTDYITSKPQLIWADAVYFLSQKAFLSRLTEKSDSERQSILTSFVLILSAFGSHDYAVELLDSISSKELVGSEVIASLRNAIARTAPSLMSFFIRLATQISIGLILYLLAVPFPSRRRFVGNFLRRRIESLGMALVKISGRTSLNEPHL
jgi:FkbM family methyltransferase